MEITVEVENVFKELQKNLEMQIQNFTSILLQEVENTLSCVLKKLSLIIGKAEPIIYKVENDQNISHEQHQATPLKDDQNLVADYAVVVKDIPIKGQNTQNKKIQCEYCQGLYASKKGKKRHIKEVHLKIRNYQCELCGFDFASRCNLMKHINTGKHVVRKCSICEYTCFRKAKLLVHIQEAHCSLNIVTNSSTYTSQTLNEDAMMQHSNTPTSHMCYLCNKMFLDSTMLKEHIEINHN